MSGGHELVDGFWAAVASTRPGSRSSLVEVKTEAVWVWA